MVNLKITQDIRGHLHLRARLNRYFYCFGLVRPLYAGCYFV